MGVDEEMQFCRGVLELFSSLVIFTIVLYRPPPLYGQGGKSIDELISEAKHFETRSLQIAVVHSQPNQHLNFKNLLQISILHFKFATIS